MWRAADKVVYSRTLDSVSSARTRIERDFKPDAIRQMKAAASLDITVGGPHLAAEAIRAGLVDEYQDELRFGSGVLQLRYRTTAL